MIEQRIRKFRNYAKPLLVASGVLVSGVVASGVSLPVASAAEMPVSNVEAAASSNRSSDQSGQADFANGVYLYGESPEPDQVGSAYLVFEVSDTDRVVGAFYMPYSSFDCFQGEFQGNHLNLTVINAYTQTPHPYSIAVQTDTYIASNGNPITAEVGLEGYHNIPAMSENDQHMLETCKADFQ